MKFEGSTALNPRIPKELLIRDGKPKGPFAIRDNAKEIARKIGYNAIWVPSGLGGIYYVVPVGMNEDFEMGDFRDKKNNPIQL